MRHFLGYLWEGARTHPFNFFTLVIAVAAAGFAGWSAWEAHQTRLDAKTDAEKQARDVERSRKAAEESASATRQGAAAAWNGVNELSALVANGRAQLSVAKRSLELEQLPSIGLDSFSYGSFVDKLPRMDHSKPTEVRVGVANHGKPAFGCQIKNHGKFDNPTDIFEYPDSAQFPAIVDLMTNAQFAVKLSLAPPASLSPVSGGVRLYLYGRVDCPKTLIPKTPYHGDWCIFFPVSRSGEILDDMHGCSGGKPSEKNDAHR